MIMAFIGLVGVVIQGVKGMQNRFHMADANRNLLLWPVPPGEEVIVELRLMFFKSCIAHNKE